MESPESEKQRERLIGFAEGYVEAMLAHEPSRLPVAKTVKITENAKSIRLGEGLWKTVTERKPFTQYVADAERGCAGFYGVFMEGTAYAMLALRLKIEGDKIVEIESLVSRLDNRTFGSPEKLIEANPIFDRILPAEDRVPAERMIEIAHIYYDAIESNRPHIIPIDSRCSRRENGAVTLANPDPSKPAPLAPISYIPRIRDRRVAAIDVPRGQIWLWALFDIPGDIPVPDDWPGEIGGVKFPDIRKMPRTLMVAQLFHIERDKIRDMEVFMYNFDLGTTSGW